MLEQLPHGWMHGGLARLLRVLWYLPEAVRGCVHSRGNIYHVDVAVVRIFYCPIRSPSVTPSLSVMLFGDINLNQF